MNRILACAVAAALLIASSGSPTWAREAKGKIKSWETTTRIVTLEDGTQYIVTDEVKTTTTEKIKPGKHVKLTYDEREGKNWATDLEEVEAP
jgi:uncharacterized OB-fold protein